jgi:hypothetical protein
MRTLKLFPASTQAMSSPFGSVPANRLQVDTNVRAFQPLDINNVVVLDTSLNLWLEKVPFGKVPRVPIDRNVSMFQAIDGEHILVLGNDGTCGSPPRTPIVTG